MPTLKELLNKSSKLPTEVTKFVQDSEQAVDKMVSDFKSKVIVTALKEITDQMSSDLKTRIDGEIKKGVAAIPLPKDGKQGDQGLPGKPGPKGDMGQRGDRGPAGLKGDPGQGGESAQEINLDEVKTQFTPFIKELIEEVIKNIPKPLGASATTKMRGGGSSLTTLITPSGAVDGSNAVFTLSHNPRSGGLLFFLNGQLLTGGGVDYSISSRTVTLNTAPQSGDIVRYIAIK